MIDVARAQQDGRVHKSARAIIDIVKQKAQLLVRNLDEDLVERLRRRAAEHRRSAEAEHREILRTALRPRGGHASLKAHLQAMPNVGRDEDFARRADKGRPVRF
jgi:plasmid stability protein